VSDIRGISSIISGFTKDISYALNYGNITIGETLLGPSMPIGAEASVGGEQLPEEATQPQVQLLPLEEPRVSSSASPATVNIEVTGGTEQELKDLERKISKILEEQMRRYYGIG
jgi:hypothetical protein